MVLADVREEVKDQLDIDTSIDTFDDSIERYIGRAVKRLYPFVQQEIDAQTVSLSANSYGRAELSFSTLGIESARYIEVSAGDDDYQDAEFRQHGDTLTIDGISSSITSAKIYGLGKYTLATIPDYLEEAIIFFALAAFYKMLVGNKRKYNVYMQNGRPAVENMQDVAAYYEQEANTFLNDRAELYGQS